MYHDWYLNNHVHQINNKPDLCCVYHSISTYFYNLPWVRKSTPVLSSTVVLFQKQQVMSLLTFNLKVAKSMCPFNFTTLHNLLKLLICSSPMVLSMELETMTMKTHDDEDNRTTDNTLLWLDFLYLQHHVLLLLI